MTTTTTRPAGAGRHVRDDRGSKTQVALAADVQAETETARRIARLLAERESADAGLVILTAPVGAGLAGAVRRALAEGGDRAAWVHTLPERADGAQRALAHGEDAAGEQLTVAAPSMADTLDELTGLLGEGTVLVIDAFHALTPASAHTVIMWAQAARARGIRIVLGYHPALDRAGVGALLQVAMAATWIDVHGLREEDVRADLQALGAWANPAVLEVAVEACAGNAALLRALRRSLEAEAVITGPAVAAALVQALEGSSLRLLTEQGGDAAALAALAGLVRPEVALADAAAALGIAPAEAVRLEKLVMELGLCPTTRPLARAATDAVHQHVSLETRRVASRAARDLLDATQVGQGRFFAIRAAVGDPLTGCLELARAAYDEAAAAAKFARCEQIAATLMSRSDDPGEVAWAKAARLAAWVHTDWAQFATQAHWCADPAVAAYLERAGVPDWLLALECPQARGRLSPAREAGEAELFGLAEDAIFGRPCEDAVAEWDTRLAGAGLLAVPAPVASRMALAWLGLADYEAAHRWASVAAFTAGTGDTADCAMGHLIAAHASLRLGQFAAADQQAKAAAELFGGFGARTLEKFAVLTRAHVAGEAGEPVPVLPELEVGAPAGIAAYHSYVQARGLLKAGRGDAAVRAFFECGRSLKALGIDNPSLLNWRPHLIALFRASGQHDFMRHVEDDLVAAWRAWARVAPQAAARRSEVLGARAAEVCDPAAAASDEPSIDALSAAEMRVVELVVKGASNRDAAKTLYLSKRTVDTHLGNVYRKLGLSSRDELTTLVQRLAPRRGPGLHVFG